jgi:hypothetical protein
MGMLSYGDHETVGREQGVITHKLNQRLAVCQPLRRLSIDLIGCSRTFE